MKWIIILQIVLLSSSLGRGRLLSGDVLAECLVEFCITDDFHCLCEQEDWWNYGKCIPPRQLCDGVNDCDDGSDEIDCSCSSDELQCGRRDNGLELYDILPHCIPMKLVNDGKADCINENDETRICRECDGRINCPSRIPNDEANCSNECTSRSNPIRCACNQPGNFTCTNSGYVCYSEFAICNSWYRCSDKSDEINCSCDEDEFQCQCYKNDPVDCSSNRNRIFRGCIRKEEYRDGVVDCSDGSDENLSYRKRVTCDQCKVTINRFSNLSECKQPACDISTCYNVLSLHCSTPNCNDTEVICMSNCSETTSKQCDRGFQCADGSLGLAFQFCDGRIDCPDNSDEIKTGLGFKCLSYITNETCVLPQRNLYDNVAQCSDESDLCLNNSCFECLDQLLLISSKQVCDGVFDCYDWSDECLCVPNLFTFPCSDRYPIGNSESAECFLENMQGTSNPSFKNNVVLSNSLVYCSIRLKSNYLATVCDGRPECGDFSDECNCPNPPDFCNDTCHTGYFVGDRYCDGIEDDFHISLNRSDCPKGFDEINCPRRFYCQAKNKISIDTNQVCDGRQDCDDNSDETNCPNYFQSVFSSQTQLIGDDALRIIFWIMGFVVVSGNLYVIITAVVNQKLNDVSTSIKYQQAILFNISVADFIMGIYLLIISAYGASFSGYYGQVDYEWRSSLSCSIVGSLAVLSSEASCFFMALLTGSRLYAIYQPFSARSSSTIVYKIAVGLIWMIAFIISIVPFLPITSSYFVHSLEFSNRFSLTPISNNIQITKFACRLAQITNKSIEDDGRDWDLTKEFFEENFPDYTPGSEFGYYGQTSVCMPRFFVRKGENSWEYSFVIITTNFLLFFFVAVSYILIVVRASKSPITVRKNEREKRNAKMQGRISRIIITDFICWIPICIMAFISFGGHYIGDVAYVVSAGLLLPINSAFNPLLYSSLLDKLFDKCKSIEANRNKPSENTSLQVLK